MTNYSKLIITDAQFLAAMPYMITVVLIFIMAIIKNRAEEAANKKRKMLSLQEHK